MLSEPGELLDRSAMIAKVGLDVPTARFDAMKTEGLLDMLL